MTDLRETLVEAIDSFDRFGVCEGQHVGAQSDDVAMFPVQCDVRDVWPPAVNVKESPPICALRKKWPWIFVQSSIKVVTGNKGNEGNSYCCWPMPKDKRKY